MRSIHRPLTALLALLAILFMVACSATRAPGPSEPFAPPTVAPLFEQPVATVPAADVTSVVPATAAPSEPQLVINTAGARTPIDPRVFGTNIPAWLGAQQLTNPSFLARARNSGMSVVRLPGGSWSNSYDWLACEQGEAGCNWPWAARPSDFIAMVEAVGAEVMWTVSPNTTSLQAAALVAFFNGDVDDDRPLGIDVRGRDWLTVGHWAQLRRESGHPEPLKVMLWEFGNEIYAAAPPATGDCVEWGWEHAWTCDGTTYVEGSGQGQERYEGYLEFRQAMSAVDPTIVLGAVGVADPNSWSRWGDKVIAAAGQDLDLYIVHYYAYDNPPAQAVQALAQPQRIWQAMVSDIHESMDRSESGRRAPIAVTEYNLISVLEQDTDQLMNRAVNALFLADTLGQMIESGIGIANHWNFMNGEAQNGASYGMLHSESFAPWPHYYVFPLWRRVGEALIPLTSSLDDEEELSAYAGVTPQGSYTVLAINKTDRSITSDIVLEGVATFNMRVDQLRAESLEDTSITVNGLPAEPERLFTTPAEEHQNVSGSFDHAFPPYSITLIEMTPAVQP
jgi:alpha-L-arabinofuranosidase